MAAAAAVYEVKKIAYQKIIFLRFEIFVLQPMLIFAEQSVTWALWPPGMK
jgi:hypothetical protein